MRRSLPIVVCFLALAGCAPIPVGAAADYPTDGTTGTTTTQPGSPTNYTPPTNPLNNGATYSGIYNANALLDFTQKGVLPGLESPALLALSQLSTDPGTALVGFAQAAGAINLDATTRSLIAQVITQQLENVIPQNVQDALDVISNITMISKTTTLQNTITVHTPSSSGQVVIDITVNGAAFDFSDINGYLQHVVVKTTPVNLATSRSTITATLQPHNDAPIADADLIFNGGSLSLPIGDFINQAMGPLVFQPEFGTTDLQTTLTQLLAQPCVDLGGVVEQGVLDLTDLDVGSEIGTTICNVAVNLAAAEVVAEIGKLKIDGVKITNGRATLFDVSPKAPTADHKSDLLGDGTWTWTFGGADVPATILDGTRIGNAL